MFQRLSCPDLDDISKMVFSVFTFCTHLACDGCPWMRIQQHTQSMGEHSWQQLSQQITVLSLVTCPKRGHCQREADL